MAKGKAVVVSHPDAIAKAVNEIIEGKRSLSVRIRERPDVVADVPGVGEHLQDHLEVYIQHRSRQPVSVAPAKLWRNRPWVGFQWLFLRRGPGATNHFEGGGFARSNDDVAYPNLMFHFLPIASTPRSGSTTCRPTRTDANGSRRST